MPHYSIFTKKYQTLNAYRSSKIIQHAPLFSIVTITRDNLEGLKHTYLSLKSQSMLGFEWIVIDGASTDGSLDYLADNPPDILHSAPDNGIYDAMNHAIPLINGKFCLFLNAGDQLAAPWTLAHIEKTLINETECLFAYGDSHEQSGDIVRFKPSRSHALSNLGLFTHHQSMLYASERLKCFRYDTAYTIAADYDLTLRFLNGLESARILKLPVPIALYEGGGISQVKAHQGRMEQLRIRRNVKTCHPLLNAGIFAAQWLAWQCRKWVPALYWTVKSRH